MKKITFLILFIIITIDGFSQTKGFYNKRGHNVLPEKGDIAIGINAAPFFQIFRDNSFAIPGFSFVDESQAVFAKYFLNNRKALRAKFRINTGTEKKESDAVNDPDIINDSEVYLGIGMENRLGKSRIQGFYGIEGGLFFSKFKTKQELHNITLREESDFGTSIQLFLGAEYFIAQKLSLGGQFGWAMIYYHSKKPEQNLDTTTFGFENLNGTLFLMFHF